MKVSNKEERPVVVIIDDDFEIRETLEDLIHSVGLQAETFPSVQEFLGGYRREQPGCLVLDVRLPGRSGLDFHDDLIKANVHLPVVFISGHADVPMSVRAMKAGAVEFLTKPVHHQDLLDAIQLAIKQGHERRDDERNLAELRREFDKLTPREREVMLLVATGRPNKQVAADMGISMTTVKLYRGQVMQKMQARSLAELVRIADNLNVPGPKV